MSDGPQLEQVRENLLRARSFGLDAELLSNFYSDSPFPDYKEIESVDTLLAATRRNPFLDELIALIKPGNTFLEVGCGTGQLTNFLAAGSLGRIIGVDGSIQSIEVAADFAAASNLSRATFLHADLFDLNKIYGPDFDYVWCSGVLHHTRDPGLGFKTIVDCLRPGGLVFVGLYNHIARLRTVFRQRVFNLLGRGNLAFKLIATMDPYARSCKDEQKKFSAWMNDQYMHPIESLHSMSEVFAWFENLNIELVGAVPNLGSTLSETLIEPEPIEFDPLAANLAEFGALFSSLGSEGGLFLMVGRKKIC